MGIFLKRLKYSIEFPIFSGMIVFLCLWGLFKPFTTTYFLFAFLIWTAVNFYGINYLLLNTLKFKSIFLLVIKLLFLFFLLQKFYNAILLKIFSLSFCNFFIATIFFIKSPKRLKIFLLSQQFLFFIILIISLVNIEAHLLVKGEALLGSRYLHGGLTGFIAYSLFYYIEKTGLNGTIYKMRLLLLPVGIMTFSYGTFLIFNEYRLYNLGTFIGFFGGLVIPLALLFFLRKKYRRYV